MALLRIAEDAWIEYPEDGKEHRLAVEYDFGPLSECRIDGTPVTIIKEGPRDQDIFLTFPGDRDRPGTTRGCLRRSP